MPASANAHAKRIVFLLWVLVAFFYFYLSYDYIRVTMNDREFADYLQYVVKLAGAEHRPAKEARALILIKAEELSLPVRGEQVTIVDAGETLNIAVDYEVDIEVPVLQREIYTKKFAHKVKYEGPR